MTESAQRFLSDLIKPEDRFARSTNIEFDYRDPDTTPDYKFTPKALNLLEDVLDTRLGIRRDRAWTIVGPYGSGKSIFCLLILQLLSGALPSSFFFYEPKRHYRDLQEPLACRTMLSAPLLLHGPVRLEPLL